MSVHLHDKLRAYVEQGCTITREGLVIDSEDTIVCVLPEGTDIPEDLYEKHKAKVRRQAREARQGKEEAGEQGHFEQ